MITAANQLYDKRWGYNALIHNSLDFTINVIKSGDYEVAWGYAKPQSFYKDLTEGKAVISKSGKIKSFYKVVNGKKQYKIWNNGKGRATGNAYCKKGCD